MRRQKWFFPFLSPIKNSISFYGQQNTLLLIEIPEKSTTAKKCSLILSATADQNVIKIKEWSEEVIVIVAYRSTIRLAILFTAGGFLNQVTYTHKLNTEYITYLCNFKFHFANWTGNFCVPFNFLMLVVCLTKIVTLNGQR